MFRSNVILHLANWFNRLQASKIPKMSISHGYGFTCEISCHLVEYPARSSELNARITKSCPVAVKLSIEDARRLRLLARYYFDMGFIHSPSPSSLIRGLVRRELLQNKGRIDYYATLPNPHDYF
jgi:hypothetical protein